MKILWLMGKHGNIILFLKLHLVVFFLHGLYVSYLMNKKFSFNVFTVTQSKKKSIALVAFCQLVMSSS